MSGFQESLYANIGDLIDGGVAPETPTVGLRSDGACLFYRGQVNGLTGHPESGKTQIALASLVDELARSGSGLFIDMDHNGAGAVVAKLIQMGADEHVLRNPELFRYSAPDDAETIAGIIRDTKTWSPTVVIVDSMGELLPIYGASSNSPDDFTRVHTLTLKPLADSGAAVIVIDHLAKNAESQSYGSTGTAAKKRVIGGSSLRVTVVEAFKPGQGGKAQLTINKDRHGGLRATSPSEEREPLAATFKMWDENGDIRWTFIPPADGERSVTPEVAQADLRMLSTMDPPPVSQREVKDRLGWGSTRALRTLQEWRRLGSPTDVLPAPQPPMSGAQEHSPFPAPQLLPGSTGATYSPGIARGTSKTHQQLLPAPTHRGAGAREHANEAVA